MPTFDSEMCLLKLGYCCDFVVIRLKFRERMVNENNGGHDVQL